MQGNTVTVAMAAQTAVPGVNSLIGAFTLTPYIGGFVTHVRVSYAAIGARGVANVNTLHLGSGAAPSVPIWQSEENFSETFCYQGEATFYAGREAPGLPIIANTQHIWAMSSIYAPVRFNVVFTVWSP